VPGVEIAGNEAVTAIEWTFWDLGGREAHSEHAVEASPMHCRRCDHRPLLFYLLTNRAASRRTRP
jgi:hypothetical protein